MKFTHKMDGFASGPHSIIIIIVVIVVLMKIIIFIILSFFVSYLFISLLIFFMGFGTCSRKFRDREGSGKFPTCLGNVLEPTGAI